MSGSQQLWRRVSERLSAAAEEVCGLFEEAMAEYRGEIFQLRHQIEQLTVLEPRVMLLRADAKPEEVSVLQQQPEESTVEQHEARVPQQVKEEQDEICIIPNLNTDPSEDPSDPFPESETNPPAACQMIPTVDSVTMTLSHDGEWVDGGSSVDRRYADNLKQICKLCRFCRRTFSKYSDLIRHMEKTHVGKKPFKCSQCDREFSRQDHLALHSRVHTGVKPYKCSFCGKSFSQTSQLNVHLRIHTGEKPYFCKICGKKVAHSSHIKMCAKLSAKVIVEKLLRCPVCGKKFHTASDLSVHAAVHNASKTLVQQFA